MINSSELTPNAAQALKHLHSSVLPQILTVQGTIIRAAHEFMAQKGLVNVQPLMLSPVTDPLNHEVTEASITYADQEFALMKSMIVHKQLLMTHPGLDAIYIISPNVRLENADRADDGRHLFEFSQIDFEFKNKDLDFVLGFIEEFVRYIFNYLNNAIPEVIKQFRGELLTIPGTLERYTTGQLRGILGKDFERLMSEQSKAPFFLLDHKREFYDREDPANLGHYRNYDLIWPEGFGEGLSGAEREHDFDIIMRRMDETGTNKVQFADYISIAKAGLLNPSAGAGLGIERITRFVTRTADVNDVTAFSRKPHAVIPF